MDEYKNLDRFCYGLKHFFSPGVLKSRQEIFENAAQIALNVYSALCKACMYISCYVPTFASGPELVHTENRESRSRYHANEMQKKSKAGEASGQKQKNNG